MRFLFISIGCFMYTFCFAQLDNWQTEYSKDKRVEVKYLIKNEKNDAGKKVQIVEYESSMISAEVSIAQCIDLMKNVDLHKDFLQDTEQSYKIEDLSEDAWSVYYYINSIWPLPDTDCVAKVIYEQENEQTVSFTSISTPEAFEKKEVERMVLNDAKYTFETLTDDTVKITIWVKFQPVVNAPKWLLNTWFPKGPAEMLYKLEKVAGGL